MTDLSDLYIGVMSGTSLDGIDAVAVDFSAVPARVLGTRFDAYPESLRRQCLALNVSGPDELDRSRLVAIELSRRYADCVGELLVDLGIPRANCTAIGCHGQTVRHRPESGYSIQLVDGALVAELTGIRTVVDFRSRDIAAGGQGAPLVPAFHRAWFGESSETRCILNIGGIANVTVIRPDGTIGGFDTGPGNCLLDTWAHRAMGLDFDAQGAYAARGRVVSDLLESLLADPYFALPAPKSTGREYFGLEWLSRFALAMYSPEDVQCTLTELTAASIAQAIRLAAPDTGEVFVCGGGAHNDHLMSRIRALLSQVRVESTDTLGLAPDWVEATAFAWLARCAVRGAPGNDPAVTGARGHRVLGAVYSSLAG